MPEAVAVSDAPAAALPAGLPAWACETAEARLAVVMAAESLIADVPRGARVALLEDFVRRFNAGQTALEPYVYERIGRLTLPTLRRWRRSLRDQGPAALVPRYGHRRGDGVIDRDPEIRDWIVAQITARPHISTTMLMEGLRARFRSGRRLPSWRTLQRWVARWRDEHRSELLAIADPDAWRSRYQAAAGSRSEGLHRPNQLWELDSSLADVLLIDAETGRPRRHALIQCIDVATRRVAMLVARTSTAAAIAALLRRCILEWGVPERVKTDNGQDYTSRAIETLLEALEIERELCPPFTPECKPHVERAFRTFQHGIVELLPGYVGHNVAERQAIESRRSFAQRLGEQDAAIAVEMTADEFQTVCDRWARDLYQHRVHRALGRTPFQAAAAWRGPIRRVADERALDILLLPAAGRDAIRTVGKQGIRVQGGLYSAPALGAIVGQPVRVLTDPADLGHVYVFRPDGEFLCEATDPRRRGISAAEIAAAKRAVQRRVMTQAKAEARRRMRAVRPERLADEIMDHASERAAKLLSMPQRTEPHTTPAIAEAARAARVLDFTARRDGEAERERRDRIRERLERERPASPDPRQAKFARALEIERRIEAGEPVDEADARWVRLYRQSAEYRAMRRMTEAAANTA